MKLLTDTPFQVGIIPSLMRPPKPSLLVVVKGTFDLCDGSSVTIAENQTPLSGDVYDDEDPTRSLVYPSDFALIKPSGECFVLGSCYPPTEEEVNAIAFEVGTVRKGIGIRGDRVWESSLLGTKPSKAAPFSSMPLSWNRSYGGPGIPSNPEGLGAPRDGNLKGAPLPNLERIDAPLTSPKDQPEPISTYPISPVWHARLRHAGTYDKAWQSERYPYLPKDFDPAYHHAAPTDQRIDGFWRGDEEISLRNIIKHVPLLKSRLPGLRVRAFATQADDTSETLQEIPMVLDTVIVQSDRRQVECVWRGLIDISDVSATNIGTLLIAHESSKQNSTSKEWSERIQAIEVLNQLERSGFKPRTPESLHNDATQILDSYLETTKIFDGEKSRPESYSELKTMLFEKDLGRTLTFRRTDDAATLKEETPPAAVEALGALDEENSSTMAPLVAETPLVSEEQASLLKNHLSKALEQMPSFETAAAEIESTLASLVTAARVEAPAAEETTPNANVPPTLVESAPLTRRELVLETVAEGAPVNLDLSEVDLSSEQLGGMQAPGVLARRAIFAGAMLEGAILKGAQLSNSDFRGAKLAGADLSGCDLTGCNFEGAVLDDTNLDNANLSEARLQGVSLVGASLQKADLYRAVLSGASLQDIVASKANFTLAVLEGAQAERGDFAEAKMHGADLRGVNFQHTNLQKLRSRDAAIWDEADLRHANAREARIVASSLKKVNFSFATLDEADFTKSSLAEATFVACSMRKARFQEANLTKSAIQKSDALRASFREAILSGADLRGSNLYCAEFYAAHLDDVRLELANITGTRLEGV